MVGGTVPTSEEKTGLIETSLNESQGIFMASNGASHPPLILLSGDHEGRGRAFLFPYPDFRDRNHGHEAGRMGGEGGGERLQWGFF